MPHYDFDFLVIIGRFQPVHKGHQELIVFSLQQARQLMVLCGSDNQHRSVRNPWTSEERETMLRSIVPKTDQARLRFFPIADRPFSDKDWAREAERLILNDLKTTDTITHPRIGLISADRDLLVRYAQLFPHWQSIFFADTGKEQNAQFKSTDLRNQLFQQPLNAIQPTLQQALPVSVLDFITQFCATPAFQELREEHRFLTNFKRSWEAAPYPPTFVTVDAIVTQNECILLVERKNRPGKGLFALPGGFIDQGEPLFQGCLRELREETRLAVPQETLTRALQGSLVCDAPYRSARGRTITHVFYMALPSQASLPEVEGCDDAKQAIWVPISSLNPATLFEDHYFIIQKMLHTE